MDVFALKSLMTTDLAWTGWAVGAVFTVALVGVIAWISYTIDHQSRLELPRAAPFGRGVSEARAERVRRSGLPRPRPRNRVEPLAPPAPALRS